MTGYGRGEAEIDGTRAVAEIRSVNHRFLDLKLRGSGLGMDLEEAIRSKVKKSLARGSVTVTVRTEQGASSRDVRIDVDAAERAFASLRELAERLGVAPPQDLGLVCSIPGVVVVGESVESEPVGKAAFLSALDVALNALISMREREGEILTRDLESRLGRIAELLETLSESAKQAPMRAQLRLEERIERLLSGGKVEVDADRIAQEVAVLADRQDVTEEIVRVRAHLEQMGKLMSEVGAVGRRLDFLVQELGREFNTIASKSQSADISSAVVEAKAELEKLREQVQNLE